MKYKKDFTEGYRKPSKSEIEQITNYMSHHLKTKMRIYYLLVFVFLFLTITVFVNATLDYSNNLLLFGLKIFLTMLLSYGSWYFQTKGRKIQTLLSYVYKGDFLIAPCKGYECNDNRICVHRGSICLEEWFEMDVNSIRLFREDKNYSFKLMKLEYIFKDKKETIKELFSNEKLTERKYK